MAKSATTTAALNQTGQARAGSMGVLYKRKVRVCSTCRARLDTTAAQQACTAARHAIRVQEQSIWWVRYRVKGRLQCVSSRSVDRTVAEALLAALEPATVPSPAPTATESVLPPDGPITFAEAAADLIADYEMNRKRSIRTLRLRIEKHLRPAFGTSTLGAITTSLVRTFITRRQAAGASNATINRDLITLKRMLTLAVQGGRLVAKPYIPLLKESNVRRGFFEPEQFAQIRALLPSDLQGIAAFAFITGWRTPSEILPMEWRQVDFASGEVRLDPGTTKNGEGRVFPFTQELRRILAAQQRMADQLKDRGIPPRYVFCYTEGKRAGQRISESAFIHRWWHARTAAGCPQRIPHDFRRTAVRNLVRAGVPERVAMQLTGHKTRAIFERYNITSPNDLREAAERLDRYSPTAR